MKVGDLVYRRLNNGIDKGVGLIVSSQPGNNTATGHSTTFFKVKFINNEQPLFYEAENLEVASESR